MYSKHFLIKYLSLINTNKLIYLFKNIKKKKFLNKSFFFSLNKSYSIINNSLSSIFFDSEDSILNIILLKKNFERFENKWLVQTDLPFKKLYFGLITSFKNI